MVMGGTHAYQLTLDQYLAEYRKKRNIIEDNRPRLFALCAVDNIVSTFIRTKYKESDVFVDGQHDTGIDGLAIIVNGELVTSPEDVERSIADNHNLKVRFIFVQATLEREFRHNKMTGFYTGVWNFFHPKNLSPRSDRIAEAIKLKDAIFEKSRWMRSGRPELYMFYVSAGQWVGDNVLTGTVNSAEELLKEKDHFKSVKFEPLDFRGFLDLRRTQQRRNSGEIHSYMLQRNHEIPGIGVSYLGSILVSDLITLIRHPSSDRLNRNVFIENVRGFQGTDNIVNSGINKTLNREDVTIFPLLNNGVTIVCRDYAMSGPKLRLYDYQIVNGCQTSSVIFENRKRLKNKDVLVPAKIVVTRDETIIESIIRSSNSQTEVTDDHILSLLPFNRRLSEYYRAIVLSGFGERLYYDLRQGEFSSNKNLEPNRIVLIKDQVQTFASMFLGRPHDAVEKTKELREEVPDKIFNPSHALDPYYTASLAMFRFRDLRSNHLIDESFERFRFQLLHVLRKKLFPHEFNLSNWRAAPILCNDANQRLMDPEDSLQLFSEAGETIRTAARRIDFPDLAAVAASRSSLTEAINVLINPNN